VSKKSRRRQAHRSPANGQAHSDPLDALPSLWAAIGAGDLLQSEIQTSAMLALPRLAGEMDADEADKFIADRLVGVAADRETPETAAFLRLLVSLGSPVVKSAARSALADLTSLGVYPIGWVAEAGKPEPRQAWRRYDIFGDREWIAVSFGYGDVEHVLLAQIERAVLPVAVNMLIGTEPKTVVDTLEADSEPFERSGEISLGEARRRLEDAVKRARNDEDVSDELRLYWALGMSRVRRLPVDDAYPVRTAEDRAAAVAQFLASPQASGLATDEARFWAEILSAYTARIPGEPPTSIGPRMLPVILLGHVAAYFTVTSAQHEAMERAITGWLAWSAEQRGLDASAAERLTAVLRETFGSFREAYDDPDNTLSRRYLADAAASAASPIELADIRFRRLFAVPEDASWEADFDPADPATRHSEAEAEFGKCSPPDGMTSAQFVAAAARVLDEIWTGTPPLTWDRARSLIDSGLSRHDAIHSLAGGGAG
jgi:hypothetical protein